MPRTVTTAILNHLSLPGAPAPAGGRAFLLADLYELVVGGTTYRYTTWGSALTGVAPASVATYSPGFLKANRMRQEAGLVVDDLEVVVSHSGQTIGGKGWVAAALAGDLDGASFKQFRAFIDPAAGTVVGCVHLFSGEVTPDEPTSTELRLTVSVPGKRFNQAFPNLVVQPNCVWDLGSTGCGWAGQLDHTATLAAGSTGSVLKVATTPGGLAGPHLWFQGAAFAGGYRRAITDTGTPSVVTFTVSPPFPSGVIEGLIGSAGALTLRRGCAKTATVCDSWYGNLSHFLGAPAAGVSSEAR